MTTLVTGSPYKKEYLPGYTGHVPSKNERFGSNSGQIKREILVDEGVHPVNIQRDEKPDRTNRLYCSTFIPAIDKNKIIHSNGSRFAKNWVCGPNHMIRH